MYWKDSQWLGSCLKVFLKMCVMVGFFEVLRKRQKEPSFGRRRLDYKIPRSCGVEPHLTPRSDPKEMVPCANAQTPQEK